MMLSPITRMHKHLRQLACFALPVVTRFGVIRLFMRNTPVYVPPEFSPQQSAAERAMRNQRVKAVETEAAQGCAATENGAVRPNKGSGDPEADEGGPERGNVR